MADGTVTVEPASGPIAAIDNDAISDGGGGTVFRQRTRVGGAGYHELAVVANAAPGASDYGLVVRDPALAAVLTALNNIFGAVDGLEVTTDMIRVDADTINLSTDGLEALLTAIRDRVPAALDADGGVKSHIQNSITANAGTGPWPVTDNGGSLTVDGTVAVTGALTDAQLRATPIPISGTVTATGLLTDTQLRATPLPVSGTVNPTTPTTVRNGQITVTTSGTRVALAGSTAVVAVVVQALSTNTGSIWVGDASVTVSNGFELQPGQSTGIAIDNLSKVFVDASTNGDKACFLGS